MLRCGSYQVRMRQDGSEFYCLVLMRLQTSQGELTSVVMVRTRAEVHQLKEKMTPRTVLTCSLLRCLHRWIC